MNERYEWEEVWGPFAIVVFISVGVPGLDENAAEKDDEEATKEEEEEAENDDELRT